MTESGLRGQCIGWNYVYIRVVHCTLPVLFSNFRFFPIFFFVGLRLAEILDFKISAANSKWRLEPADNVLMMAQTARPALLNQLILLVTIAEQKLPAMRPVKLKLTATDFLVWATAIDDETSCRNILDT